MIRISLSKISKNKWHAKLIVLARISIATIIRFTRKVLSSLSFAKKQKKMKLLEMDPRVATIKNSFKEPDLQTKF